MIRPRRATWLVLTAIGALSGIAQARPGDESLETVEVQGSRAAVRREVEYFVGNVTRMDGKLVGRWRKYVCPMVAGVSEPQANFVRQRIIEVYDSARRWKRKAGQACTPNLYVIIADDPELVVAEWKQRDPGMFRWKTRRGVQYSKGPGAVRTWHNANEDPSEGDPLITGPMGPPRSLSAGSPRIVSPVAEGITAVLVLVDAQATGKVTLAQLADYIAMVSLAQLDLTADLGGVNSILTLFAQPPPDVPPLALTEWDYAFLHALYRTSYEPVHQRRDIRARMVRELAPR